MLPEPESMTAYMTVVSHRDKQSVKKHAHATAIIVNNT